MYSEVFSIFNVHFLNYTGSSLQLIPVNMIAYRSQYGSANPTAIIAPAIAATLVSILVAIVYCKIKDYSARTDRGGRMGISSIDEGGFGEIPQLSGKGAGIRQIDRAEGILAGSRNGRGGKAV